jgi:CheY-like chemotaxis protein
VHADPGQIEQVLMNLCVNAWDAMPQGGRLTLETENVLINGAYRKTHVWANEGRYVLISVTDTGHGMDEETRSQIFEPFFTTKEVGKGTGLGLSTVYGIVKQHDGMINVYSEVGKGTTFKVYLPIVERCADEVGNKIESPVRGGTETLLFAEDHESLRRMTVELLETAGYTVLVATDGQEAVEVFEAHADEISLVLLDVVMPKLSGRDACDRIRAINPSVRTLYTSGYSANAIHTRFVLDEGIELIRKPYDMHVLLRKIREVLDGK